MSAESEEPVEYEVGTRGREAQRGAAPANKGAVKARLPKPCIIKTCDFDSFRSFNSIVEMQPVIILLHACTSDFM